MMRGPINANFINCLSSVYFVNEPLNVSGIFVAHNPEVYCIYIYNNWYALYIYIYIYIYIHFIPPDDGLQICPKHVKVELRNKLRINSESSWFSLHEIITYYCALFESLYNYFKIIS